jgi:cytochrome c-type biogenesis protein CcmH/NrfG
MKGRRARRLRPARALPWASAQEDTIPLILGAEEAETTPARPTLWQRVRVVLLALVVFLCLLTVALAASGYLGMQAGQQARLERRAALADEHYRQGLARLDAGEYELAIAEFEYALQLVPDHPLAKQGLAEARARLATRPTPTSQATEEVARELFTQAKDGLRAGRLADGRPSPEPTARF